MPISRRRPPLPLRTSRKPRPWLTAHVELPVGPMSCVIDGPTRGRPWSSAAVRSELHRCCRTRPAVNPSWNAASALPGWATSIPSRVLDRVGEVHAGEDVGVIDRLLGREPHDQTRRSGVRAETSVCCLAWPAHRHLSSTPASYTAGTRMALTTSRATSARSLRDRPLPGSSTRRASTGTSSRCPGRTTRSSRAQPAADPRIPPATTRRGTR